MARVDHVRVDHGEGGPWWGWTVVRVDRGGDGPW